MVVIGDRLDEALDEPGEREVLVERVRNAQLAAQSTCIGPRADGQEGRGKPCFTMHNPGIGDPGNHERIGEPGFGFETDTAAKIGCRCADGIGVQRQCLPFFMIGKRKSGARKCLWRDVPLATKLGANLAVIFLPEPLIARFREGKGATQGEAAIVMGKAATVTVLKDNVARSACSTLSVGGPSEGRLRGKGKRLGSGWTRDEKHGGCEHSKQHPLQAPQTVFHRRHGLLAPV